MVQFQEIKAKTIINRYKYRDNWFWCRYGINPYRGCQFACNYCDAITEKYLIHKNVEDFSRIIYVKTNASHLLENEIKKVKRDVVALSGVTDPYQPAERKYEITRKILEILRDYKFPIHIITKSDLVLRDISILSEISKNSWCTVSFTIITFNKKLLSILEPLAPDPEKRLEALKELVTSGIQAGVDFTPIVPYIADNDENVRDVIKRATESGAKYILPGVGMTLRSNQKSRFFEVLKENQPELIEKYEKLYGISQNPNEQYTSNMSRKTFELCKEFGIPNYISPPIFERPFKENFEVAYLLLLIAYFYEIKGGKSYNAWAYHKAAQNIEDLDESIIDIRKRNKLQRIPEVGSGLAKTIAEFLDSGRSQKLEEMKHNW